MTNYKRFIPLWDEEVERINVEFDDDEDVVRLSWFSPIYEHEVALHLKRAMFFELVDQLDLVRRGLPKPQVNPLL